VRRTGGQIHRWGGRRREVGLKHGIAGPAVLTELGYEPPELCNHGRFHDLVGRLVWSTALE
jgi:hypothetical protein